MDRFLDTLEALKSWWYDIHITRMQRRSLALIALTLVATSIFFIYNGRSHEVTPIPKPPDLEITSPDVIVDVAGAVVKPGVYTLPSNSRVVDAINAAGGLRTGADASDVNQARLLKDGEQVYIYSAQSAMRARPTGPININRASRSEFESLNGIGPVLASRIIAYRKANGPFSTIEDLLKVPGIGESVFSKFKSKIRV